MSKKITIIQIKTNDRGSMGIMEFTEIESKTDTFRKYVKGEIDIMHFNNICIVFNKENEKSGLPLNCMIMDCNRQVTGGLFGNICICRTGINGEFLSIRKSDVQFINERLIPVKGRKILDWQMPDI